MRVHADGRIVFAGENDTLPALLRRFEATRDEAPRAAWEAWLAGLDQALRDDQPRLEIVRAAAAFDVHFDALRTEDPLLAEQLGERSAILRSLLLEAEDQPPPAVDAGVPLAPLRMLQPPVEPLIVTSFFGLRRDPFDGRSRFHFGLDLDGPAGCAVVAAAGGTIASAGWAGGHGMRVEIDHGDGVITGYSHLSAVLVRRGDAVFAGDAIGLLGSTGRSTGPHLHFELWRDGEAEDPLDWIEARSLQISALP